MKRKILMTFALLLAIAQGAWAQTAVDLGLPSGTKWADRNVGAASATAAGTFFEWGEITAYDNNYTYSDNPTTLPMSNDAARQTWGGQWRMPTKADFQELLNSEYTTWAWTENYNSSGKDGYLITSKTNGNSIFMPLTGFYNGSLTLIGTYRGDYWSSTRSESDNSKAYWLGFGTNDYQLQNPYDRVYGFAVRPVQMFVGAGTSVDPYQISSTTDWNNLVTAVNGGESFSGKYFRQTADISVSVQIGYSSYDAQYHFILADSRLFAGTYDGDGHTTTLTISAHDDAAPFAVIDGATIKNLKTSGNVTVGRWFGAGIVGHVLGTCTITNCCSDATITSNHNANNTSSAGLIGAVQGNLTVSGCAFIGAISYTNDNTHHGGGIIGKMLSGSATVNSCLFAPTNLRVWQFNMFVGGNSQGDINLATTTNCYYNALAGGNSNISNKTQGKELRTITAASGVTVANAGAATEYNVSSITSYGTGIKYNDKLYAGNGDAVSLTLSHADAAEGYMFSEYVVTGGGTLDDATSNTPTLTMTDANQTISAEYDKLYNTTFATGSSGTGWSISPTSGITGTSVTVSYSGDHKVKSVSVTNKYAIAHSLATAVVGDIVGSDGNAYSVAEKDKLPVGVTAEAVVCYKSGSNGLAVALVNLSGTFDHTEAVDYTGSNYTGFCTAHPVSGQTWKVLSQDEFSNVYNACGGTAPTAIYPADGYSGNRGSLDTYITNAGGTAMSGNYWTATTYTGAENCFVCTNILSENVCNFNHNNTTYKYINVRYGFTF